MISITTCICICITLSVISLALGIIIAAKNLGYNQTIKNYNKQFKYEQDN